MSFALDWSALEIGKTYYLLWFSDPKRLFPDIETIVYLGEKNHKSDGKLHVFEYAGAMLERGGVGMPNDEDKISFPHQDPSCVGDLNGLIQELIALRDRAGN